MARAASRALHRRSPARAKAVDIGFTIDAEEAERLDLSLDLIDAALARAGAGGLGRPRARRAGLSEARRLPVIDWLADARAGGAAAR